MAESAPQRTAGLYYALTHCCKIWKQELNADVFLHAHQHIFLYISLDGDGSVTHYSGNTPAVSFQGYLHAFTKTKGCF